MLSRIAKVNSLSLKVLSFSSLLQIGDCKYAEASSKAFALQRYKAVFDGEEADGIDHPIFHLPSVYLPITEPIQTTFNHRNPFIKVNRINIIGATLSSIIGIGNINHSSMESRILHIRQVPYKQNMEEQIYEINEGLPAEPNDS